MHEGQFDDGELLAGAFPDDGVPPHIDLDQIDPDTSHDLTLRALTGRRLPRQYATAEPGAVPTEPTKPTTLLGPDDPPF